MKSARRYKIQTYRIPLITIGLIFIIAMDWQVATDNINTQSIIIAIAALITFVFCIQGERFHWILLCLGLATIVFGHRGVNVGYWTVFVPLQVIIWLLWGTSLLNTMVTRSTFGIQIPILLVFVVAWSVLRATITIFFTWGNWDETLAWTSPFILSFPTFWVINWLVKKDGQFRLLLRILMIVTGVMSGLGLIEYFIPSITQKIPWFFTSSYLITQDGFIRATLSFWGYPAAAAIIVWGVLIAYDNLLNKEYRHWESVLVLLFGSATIYISGQRSSWLSLAFGLVILSLPLGSSGWGKWVISTTLLFVVLNFLPAVFWNRFATTFALIRHGATLDTSEVARIERWQWALESISNQPLIGVGYGKWLTHNVFLEIGSKIGLIPALAFAIFVIQLVGRIWQAISAGPTTEIYRYSWLFMALAITWIIQMMVEVVFFIPPFAAAHWFVMALGWYLPEINSTKISETYPSQLITDV